MPAGQVIFVSKNGGMLVVKHENGYGAHGLPHEMSRADCGASRYSSSKMSIARETVPSVGADFSSSRRFAKMREMNAFHASNDSPVLLRKTLDGEDTEFGVVFHDGAELFELG
jgi:hypothetical protein